MDTIPSVFTERGFIFTLVKREGWIALFHRRKPGGTGHYGLVRIRVAPPAKIYDREYPEREVYPGSESWEHDGFTIISRERALLRFDEMCRDAVSAQKASETSSRKLETIAGQRNEGARP